MRKLKLMKTLLVAAGLCVGASNVWADTETITLLNIDYSSVSTPAWTVVGGSGSIADGAWTHTHDGGNGARSAYLDWGLSSSIDNNWTASFDVKTSTGSTWTQASDIQVAITSESASYSNNALVSSNVLLGARVATTKSNMGSDLAYIITLNNVDEATPVTLSHGTTYTFNVSVSGTSLTASIKNGNTVVYSGSATLGAFVKPRGIYDLLPRPYNSTWGVYSNTYDNIKVTKEVEAGFVEVPTATITAVDGINRTITFSCATEGVTFSYSTDAVNFTEGNSVIISENTTIYVKATKGSTSATSEGLSFEAGTAITLNTPTWTKTGYSAGVSTVTLASDQSSKLLSPTADIYYKIDGGEPTKYTSAISVNDGETLSYYATATGYTNSVEGSVFAVAPCSEPVLLSESYYRSSDGTISVNTGEVVTTIGGSNTSYYYMYCDNAHVSDYLITSSTSLNNWLLRTGGIYAGNTGNYAIMGVKKDDYVTITFGSGTESPVPTSSDGNKDEWNSTSTSYVFKVTSTMGNFRFSFARYGYIKSITVQRALANPGATVGDTGYATFAADVALDLSTLTEGFKAYFASSADGGKVTMTPATNEKIAAGEGLFIQKTGSASDFTITETREATADVDNYLVAGNGVENGIAKEDGFDKYVLGADGSSVSFFLINNTAATVPTNKAYLKVPASSGSARLTIVFDESTGISSVKHNVNNTEGYFNLNGQRVMAPAKGLYIVNGKKVIVK